MQSGFVRAKWLYSSKVVVIGQKLLYSGKSGCSGAKVVVFGPKLLYSGKNGCIGAKCLYSAEVDLFGKIVCILTKVVVFK